MTAPELLFALFSLAAASGDALTLRAAELLGQLSDRKNNRVSNPDSSGRSLTLSGAIVQQGGSKYVGPVRALPGEPERWEKSLMVELAALEPYATEIERGVMAAYLSTLLDRVGDADRLAELLRDVSGPEAPDEAS